jgi:hypothetical protein
MGLKKVRVPALFVKYILHSPHILDFHPKKMEIPPFYPKMKKRSGKNIGIYSTCPGRPMACLVQTGHGDQCSVISSQ